MDIALGLISILPYVFRGAHKIKMGPSEDDPILVSC